MFTPTLVQQVLFFVFYSGVLIGSFKFYVIMFKVNFKQFS
jgi:hypothetical protein